MFVCCALVRVGVCVYGVRVFRRNYHPSKTKTIKLTQWLAEFSYMHAFYSFQSEQCSGCLEYKYGIAQSLSSYARSLFCIVVVGISSSAGSLGGRLGCRSALSRPALCLR